MIQVFAEIGAAPSWKVLLYKSPKSSQRKIYPNLSTLSRAMFSKTAGCRDHSCPNFKFRPFNIRTYLADRALENMKYFLSKLRRLQSLQLNCNLSCSHTNLNNIQIKDLMSFLPSQALNVVSVHMGLSNTTILGTTAPSVTPRRAGSWCTPDVWPTTTKACALPRELATSWSPSSTLRCSALASLTFFPSQGIFQWTYSKQLNSSHCVGGNTIRSNFFSNLWLWKKH